MYIAGNPEAKAASMSRLEDILKTQGIEDLSLQENNSAAPDSAEDIEIDQAQIDRIMKKRHQRFFNLDEDDDDAPMYDFMPQAENVDFIEKGKVVVRVMDHHNFYEAEAAGEQYLKEMPVGLLTKLWISISKTVKE